jgi:hypothetical protein
MRIRFRSGGKLGTEQDSLGLPAVFGCALHAQLPAAPGVLHREQKGMPCLQSCAPFNARQGALTRSS